MLRKFFFEEQFIFYYYLSLKVQLHFSLQWFENLFEFLLKRVFRFCFLLFVLALGTIGCSKGGKDFSQQASSSSLNDGSVANIIFSATQNGAGQQSFSSNATIFGRVQRSGSGARMCLEKFGTDDGLCRSPSNYSTLPNSEWQYDVGSGEWKATLNPGFFSEGTYKFYWMNANSQKAAFVTLQILEAGKPQFLAVEFPYNKPETTYQQFEAIYLQVANAPASGSQSCVEAVGSGDGYCSNSSSWVNMPGNGWKYSQSLQRWESLVKAGEAPLGATRFFWKNSLTGSVSTPVIITISPDTGPILVFSKSEFGSGSFSFKTSENFFAYVINGDPNSAFGCLENLAADAGKCSSSSNFSDMFSNSDWKFDQVNQRWQAIFGPNGTTVLSTDPARVKTYWKNGSTGKISQPYSFELVK